MKTVLWFTGLSGAGKTSLAKELSAYLNASNQPTLYLDGDEIRNGLSGDLDFSEHGRTENIRRVAEMALLLLEQVEFIIVATISPTHYQRDLAKKIIGQDHFKLIYLSTPLYHPLTKHLNLVGEWNQIEARAHGGNRQESTTGSLGAILFF